MVTTSGFPKSGNHALVKAVQLLGVNCQINHLPFGSQVADKHIFIKRDPRNVVCSWLRFIGRPMTDGMFLTSFRNFQGRSLVAEMADYEGWLRDENTHVVRYEDLISDDACLRGIAEFLNIPYLESAFANLPGLTRTFFAQHSDYTQIWTPEVSTIWENEGGNLLLKQWGY